MLFETKREFFDNFLRLIAKDSAHHIYYKELLADYSLDELQENLVEILEERIDDNGSWIKVGKKHMHEIWDEATSGDEEMYKRYRNSQNICDQLTIQNKALTLIVRKLKEKIAEDNVNLKIYGQDETQTAFEIYCVQRNRKRKYPIQLMLAIHDLCVGAPKENSIISATVYEAMSQTKFAQEINSSVERAKLAKDIENSYNAYKSRKSLQKDLEQREILGELPPNILT